MAGERYSKVVTRKGRKYRYDYKDCYLQWVDKGGDVVDEIGLSRENWDDRQARNEYIDGWRAEIDESIAYMI